MYRHLIAVLCVPMFTFAQEAEPQPVRHRMTLKPNGRYVVENKISFDVKTTARQGKQERVTRDAVERTERFVDRVVRAGEGGVIELKRSYLMSFAKLQTHESDRPTIDQSPLQGQSVVVTEKRRRRDVRMAEGRGTVDSLTRRTVGLEMDWRDILADEPVAPGSEWDADATALARRMAAYLDCGTRSKMRVRYEEDVVQDGRKLAKFYVTWVLEGMRDRSLYTKVDVAGDVVFDVAEGRVTLVDLAGTMILRGAIINASNDPQIVKGQGPVSILTTVRQAPQQAAVGGSSRD